MNIPIAITVDEKTKRQIDNLARTSGKPKEAVIREVVETGLKSYQTTPSKSAKAILDVIEWAEKKQIRSGVTDLSTNHNKYAWEEK
jgi:predicted DNA-binding protein